MMDNEFKNMFDDLSCTIIKSLERFSPLTEEQRVFLKSVMPVYFEHVFIRGQKEQAQNTCQEMQKLFSHLK
jgi:hypothetical protein